MDFKRCSVQIEIPMTSARQLSADRRESDIINADSLATASTLQAANVGVETVGRSQSHKLPKNPSQRRSTRSMPEAPSRNYFMHSAHDSARFDPASTIDSDCGRSSSRRKRSTSHSSSGKSGNSGKSSASSSAKSCESHMQVMVPDTRARRKICRINSRNGNDGGSSLPPSEDQFYDTHFDPKAALSSNRFDDHTPNPLNPDLDLVNQGLNFRRTTACACACVFSILSALCITLVGVTKGWNTMFGRTGDMGVATGSERPIILPSPPDDLATSICSPKNLVDGADCHQCAQHCSVAKCCALPMDDPGNCRAENGDKCAVYDDACSYLKEIPIAPPPPSSIVDVCSHENVHTPNGYSDCHDACSAAKCCQVPKGSLGRCHHCDVGGEDYCEVYESVCPSMAIVAVPSPPHQYLRRICSDENMATLDGYIACLKSCDAARCCTMPSDDIWGNCEDFNGLACDEYAPCSVISYEFGSFGKYLSSICSDDAVQTDGGFDTCKQACGTAKCCFLPKWDSNSCTSKMSEHCEDYINACYVLDGVISDPGDETESDKSPFSDSDEASDVPPAPIGLEASCLIDPFHDTINSFVECKQECRPADCCFDQSPSGCYEKNKYTCAQWAPCSILHENKMGEPLPEKHVSESRGDEADGKRRRGRENDRTNAVQE